MVLAEKKINELKEENQRLKEKIGELQDENNRIKGGRFKFNIKKKEKKKGKPGPPVGHKGVTRKKPTHIDEYVDVYPRVCRYCGNKDIKVYDTHERHILEDIEIRVKRICFRKHYGYCPECN
jgi:hypothetical protein